MPAGPKPTGAQPAPQARRGASRTGFLRLPWVAPAALAILTALVYARSLAVPILGWDDYVYYFRDARLENLTAENIGRILTQPFFANFHPITTLTFAFDRAVWGTWVPGFHSTHLVFYIGGVVGLYFLFLRVLGSRPAAFAASAIYGAHTIHVESVAWLASRKDVVCLFFYVASILAYVHYAGSTARRWRPYALSLVLAAAAILSKGYAVILPGVLLAYDFCFPRERRHLLDKVPFIVLSAAAVLLTVYAQDRDTALVQSTLPASARIALLAKILVLYVGKTLLPVDLSAFYTVAGEPVAGSVALLGIFIALALAAGFFFLRRSVPAASFGIALFVLPLATVMNVVFTLRIWMADRYLFFPTIGSSLALVALATAFYRRRRSALGFLRPRPIRRALAVSAVALIGLYAALTFARIGVWTSGLQLWSDVLRKDLHLAGSGPVTANDLRRVTNLQTAPSVALTSLVQAYESSGQDAEARRISELMGTAAVGGYEEREMSLARQDLDAGRHEEVIRRLQPIAEGKSWLAPAATIWIGIAESRMGNVEGSRRTLRRAIEIYRSMGQPATDALFALGAMEFNRGDYAQAAEWYRQAHRESPREAKAIFHLARALEEGGNVTEAMQLYKRITRGELPILTGSQFTILDVYSQMEVIAEKQGRIQEAIGYLEEILRRAPDHPRREVIVARIATLKGMSQP